MLHEANLRCIVFTKCQNLCSFGRHVVKPGTEEQKPSENGMPEHQTGTVKPGTLNPEHQLTEPFYWAESQNPE